MGSLVRKVCCFGKSKILLGTEQAPRAEEEIDRKKSDGSYELTDAERKEKTQAGKWQYIHKFAVVMCGVTL